MKSKTIALLSVLLLASSAVNISAQTVTSFMWLGSPNSLQNDGGTNIAVNGATILTYLAPGLNYGFDPNVEFDHPLQNAYTDSNGSSEFYQALPNTVEGRFATEFMTEEQPDDFAVGQYAFAIVLNLPFASFTSLAAVPIGTYYAVSQLSPEIQNLDTELPGSGQFFDGGNIQTTMQIIPEPGTVGFLLLGAAVVGLRRFLRRG